MYVCWNNWQKYSTNHCCSTHKNQGWETNHQNNKADPSASRQSHQPYQQFLEEREAKCQQAKAKQQMMEADKVSHKTLNKLLREQATAGAETQAIATQQRICSKGGRWNKTPSKRHGLPLPITQNNDDNKTLAPEVLELPDDNWGGDEVDKPSPTKPRRSPHLMRTNLFYVTLISKHIPTGIAYLQGKCVLTGASVEYGY